MKRPAPPRAPQTIHDFDLALADALAGVLVAREGLKLATAKAKEINAGRNRLVGKLLAESTAQIKRSERGGRL